jgi:curved DNA-binding protein
MAIEYKDYYKTLDVPRTATADQLKSAFRKLARRYHPDVAKGGDKKKAEEKFKEINEAYEVLSDADKRKRYDELGPNWDNPAAGAGNPFRGGGPGAGAFRGAQRRGPRGEDFEFGGSTGFSDFFEQFFGGGRPGAGSRRGFPEEDHASEGSDVEADLMVTLEEAFRGATRKLTLRRSGSDGSNPREDTYQVRIPAGVRGGQRIRLAGQGSPGSGGGPAGDLYLRVHFAQHPDFRVEDSDLYFDLEVAPWETVLGAKIKIPTLDGPTLLTLPPGSAGDSKLRLRARGLPREGGERGDFYAVVKIQTPPAAALEERALWEKLAATSKFDPRNPD